MLAGPWLKYKGHLDIVSNCTLIGATNDQNGKVNLIKNQMTGDEGTIPDVARYYKKNNQPWIVIGDENYGEGSAREHAALQPRYLGCSAIIARSFARIHENNLKKQGILPLTFDNPEDYKKVPAEGARISTEGLVDLVNGRDEKAKLSLVVETGDQSFKIPVKHTMSKDQLEWFYWGSALNMIRAQQQK